jgi:hypothetical protein
MLLWLPDLDGDFCSRRQQTCASPACINRTTRRNRSCRSLHPREDQVRINRAPLHMLPELRGRPTAALPFMPPMEKLMFCLVRYSCALALALFFSLLFFPNAFAHCFVGARFFPATLATDDPCVADEMSLPTVAWSKTGDVPPAKELDISGEIFETHHRRFRRLDR